jgi:hypothetical protein
VAARPAGYAAGIFSGVCPQAACGLFRRRRRRAPDPGREPSVAPHPCRSQKSRQMMTAAMIRIVASIGEPILTAGPPLVLLAHFGRPGVHVTMYVRSWWLDHKGWQTVKLWQEVRWPAPVG